MVQIEKLHANNVQFAKAGRGSLPEGLLLVQVAQGICFGNDAPCLQRQVGRLQRQRECSSHASLKGALVFNTTTRAHLVPQEVPRIPGPVHRHRALVLKHLDSGQNRLGPHGRVVWPCLHRGGGGRCLRLGGRRRRGAALGAGVPRWVVLLGLLGLLRRLGRALIEGGPLRGGGLRGAGGRGGGGQRVAVEMRVLVVVQVSGRRGAGGRRLVVAEGGGAGGLAVARPPVKRLRGRRRRLVVAQGGGVVGVAVAVLVPRLLVVLRHAVLVGRVRVIVAVLWFLVAAAANVVMTGGVVVISVRLLGVIALLGVAVRQRPRVVSGSSSAIGGAVGILSKHLAEGREKREPLAPHVRRPGLRCEKKKTKIKVQ